MPQIQQYHQVLWRKIKPSADIQQMGSSQMNLRGTYMFGPQIRQNTYRNWSNTVTTNPKLRDLLNQMNT